MTTRRGSGLLHWVFPAMLLVGAAGVLFGGRDLTEAYSDLQALAPPPRPEAVAWLQRVVSVLLLVAACEQAVNHQALGRRVPSMALLLSFMAYWAGTVAAPALLGAYPHIRHDLLYAPALGVAACLAGPLEKDRILRAARDALVALMLAGLLMVPLRAHAVLDPSYAAGLVAGLPRFAGLTAHPVTQGSLAQVALLLLWAVPYRRAWANRLAWALALGVLFIAQSKAAWIAGVLCLATMALVRHGGGLYRDATDPRRGGFGVAALALACAAIAAAALWVVVGDGIGRIARFIESPEGAQLATLTGRDRIWAIAAQEWREHPVFGYGLDLWNSVYRAQIGLPNATHAHNQFMDDAARAGSVGLAASIAYVLVLLALSVRYARATGGLAPALWLSLALRAISEVPLSLLGYGTELFVHLLLLATLAAAASAAPRAQPAAAARAQAPARGRVRSKSGWGVAS